MKEMIKKLQKRSNKKGFTLVEIIVVLVILAILAAIAVPAVLGYIDDAKDSKYIAEARSIYIVVQTEEAKYRAENGLTANQACPDTLYTDTLSKKGNSVGVVAEKTGYTNITVSAPTTVDGKNQYTLSWTSDKAVSATLTSNKDVKIN